MKIFYLAITLTFSVSTFAATGWDVTRYLDVTDNFQTACKFDSVEVDQIFQNFLKKYQETEHKGCGQPSISNVQLSSIVGVRDNLFCYVTIHQFCN